MATFIGFSTQEVNQPRTYTRPGTGGGVGNMTNPTRIGRKFRLLDNQLVIRDLVNALHIKQGDKVGQPGYGTTLWSFVFEPNISAVRTQIEDEIRRVASLDPRIELSTVSVFEKENGILVELQMTVSTLDEPVQVTLFMNRYDGSIRQLGE